MPRELGLPRYLDENTAPGSKVVESGEYVGYTVSPKFKNRQHRFMQLEDGQEVILSGGQLDWRFDQGHLVEGNVYNVFFEGKKEIEKGKWAGTDAKQYKLELYTKAEVEELLKSFKTSLQTKAMPTGMSKAEEEVSKLPEASATESLEGLE